MASNAALRCQSGPLKRFSEGSGVMTGLACGVATPHTWRVALVHTCVNCVAKSVYAATARSGCLSESRHSWEKAVLISPELSGRSLDIGFACHRLSISVFQRSGSEKLDISRSQPVGHPRPQRRAGSATSHHTDVPTLQNDLLGVDTASQLHNRARRRARRNFIAGGDDVQQRTTDVLQTNRATVDHEVTVGQLIVLVELGDPLAVSGAGEWHALVDPAKHGLPAGDVEVRLVQLGP